MWLVLIFLIVGFIFSNRLYRWADPMIRTGLYILLVAMGMNLGRNQEIMQAIPMLGAQAVLYCLATSLVSVLVLLLYERLLSTASSAAGNPVNAQDWAAKHCWSGSSRPV